MPTRRVIRCLDVHHGKVTRRVQSGKAAAGELRNGAARGAAPATQPARRSNARTVASQPSVPATSTANTFDSTIARPA